MKYNISHSLINKFNQVELKGACPLQFLEVDLLKNFSRPTSDSMKMGQYFEYLATGAIPRDGIIPIPETTAKGEPTADYKRIVIQAQNFKDDIEFYGYKIIAVSEVMEYEFEGIKVKGIQDVLVETKEGKMIIIDLKCTGLIENKWEDYGWELTKLPYKENLTNQAVLYVWLWEMILNKKVDWETAIEFQWWLYNPKSETERKIIKAVILPTCFEKIESKIKYVRNSINYLEMTGFDPKPGLHNCLDCPVETCKARTMRPVINEIELS